jgi:hypothetical protein
MRLCRLSALFFGKMLLGKGSAPAALRLISVAPLYRY